MTFGLSKRSLSRLVGVHPDLVMVVEQAILISSIDFMVLEGLRTIERQHELLAAGASQTLRSRNLTGHAVDLGAMVGGKLRWDWPLYEQVAAAMKESAAQMHVPVEWGGDWRTFKDGPHFQLPWREYPS
jgi:peptidoglycan L-alanyl-D-glutamate endopeptidase CwlK